MKKVATRRLMTHFVFACQILFLLLEFSARTRIAFSIVEKVFRSGFVRHKREKQKPPAFVLSTFCCCAFCGCLFRVLFQSSFYFVYENHFITPQVTNASRTLLRGGLRLRNNQQNQSKWFLRIFRNEIASGLFRGSLKLLADVLKMLTMRI